MLEIVFWIAVDDPWPISVMAITAPTPMMMPSVVRAERMTLRRRARMAVRRMRRNFFTGSLLLLGFEHLRSKRVGAAGAIVGSSLADDELGVLGQLRAADHADHFRSHG